MESSNWVKDFEKDTQNWYDSLMKDTREQCLMCGISPKLILQVSKLIPVELDKARDEGYKKAIGQAFDSSMPMTDAIRQERQRIIKLIDSMIAIDKKIYQQSGNPNKEFQRGYQIALSSLKERIK